MKTVLDNKDAIIYLAQERLAEWAGKIVDSSVRTARIYQEKGEKLRYYLHAIQYEFYLEDSEIISLLQCINKLADLDEWPTAPILNAYNQPDILTGIPGTPGEDGSDGSSGTDADINCVPDPLYDNMSVIEYDDAGVKTFKFGYAPLTPPTITLAITKGGLPNPNKNVQEVGVTIPTVPVVITTNKGRDAVISSEVLDPAALDASYQAQWDLANLNLGNQEVITVNDSNVTATQIYNANITDGNSTPSDSETLTFVIPFLYGSSTSLLVQATYYANLSRIIETQGNKTVTFNGVDSYFYFAYPATYPDLDKILDGNGFDAIAAFTKTTETIDMLSGAESMKVYRTAITDIPNQKYTFKF